MDKDVLFEGLSALVGVTVKPQSAAPPPLLRSFSASQAHPDILSVQDLLTAVYFDQEFWQDVNFRRVGLSSMPAVRSNLFVMDQHFFDPAWDCDFTNTINVHEGD